MKPELIHEDDYICVYVTDEKGAGGAHHTYEIRAKQTNEILDTVTFQNGPIAENGVNGSTNEAYLAIVGHRLDCFARGAFPIRIQCHRSCGVRDRANESGNADGGSSKIVVWKGSLKHKAYGRRPLFALCPPEWLKMPRP